MFAQWLSDTRASWASGEPVPVTTTCFAGPSPGNAAFAAYCGGEHGVRPRRFAGSLDVVPHAWEEELLDQVPGLYKPAIREPLSIIAATAAAKWLARGGHYRHVEPGAAPLPFKVNKGLVKGFVPSVQFGVQMVYQHLVAYYPAFHFDDAWAPWFAFLGEPERAMLPAFRGFSPTFVAAKSRDVKDAPRRREVLVGEKLVAMPEHAGDARAASLTKELEKALAKQG